MLSLAVQLQLWKCIRFPSKHCILGGYNPFFSDSNNPKSLSCLNKSRCYLLFVHFECYACVGREEKFWYKLALKCKCIWPFSALICRFGFGIGFGLGKWSLMKATVQCYALNFKQFFIQCYDLKVALRWVPDGLRFIFF